MSPNEAAELLGVSPSATRDEVQRAYDARLAEAGADEERRDAVTAARDALLAASAWQPPGSQAYPPSEPAATTPYPGYPQAAYPGAPTAPGLWNPPARPRRRLSTGAIIGITLGSVAAGLVVLLIAVTAILSIAHSASRLAESQAGSSAAPFDDPSGIPSAAPGDGAGSDGSTADDYDIDGARVHYVDGWTFELTPTLSCAGATITASFSDSPDGETMDVWSTTADLQAGVPYELTIPDDASEFDYVGIDSIDCSQA
ncbi:hypothetical protein [Leifsonia sp. fls2-241-R2A-40a]|uniref:hypothetical protein n=1 Tax=Leifsonia sp. fls2-241-R2A-40a TaxID=3040290 RepID=UPI0025507391|nr:hypothetical protein [Leifsonia sp. fls2-241-R2A-40a]